MSELYVRVIYRSGRTYRYFNSGHSLELTVKEGPEWSDDTIEIKTYSSEYKPKKGRDGVSIQIDRETMDQIVRDYKKLPNNKR